MIRDDPGFFDSRVGTYDIHRSGDGYLFATQDARRGHQFSRLMESLGRARAQTFCTERILKGIASGEMVYGYNVIGSYAASRFNSDSRLGVYLLNDYTNVMTRTAFIPKSARNKGAAIAFIDFLLSPEGQETIARSSSLLLPLHFKAPSEGPMATEMDTEGRSALPIRLGVGLLTYLDSLKKEAFLSN